MADADPPRNLEPLPLVIRSAEAKPVSQSLADDLLVEEATNVIIDVVAVAAIQAAGEAAPTTLTTKPLTAILESLRRGIRSGIRLERHQWGSWEALFVVPPDTIVWAVHEIGIPIGAALAVRLGEDIWQRLRGGQIDSRLVDDLVSDHSFDFEVYFPGGTSIAVRRKSHQERHISKVRTPERTKTVSNYSHPKRRRGRKRRTK